MAERVSRTYSKLSLGGWQLTLSTRLPLLQAELRSEMALREGEGSTLDWLDEETSDHLGLLGVGEASAAEEEEHAARRLSVGGLSSCAANLFDAMSERADEEGNTETDVAGGEDHISALPDDVLRHLMSLLLSREAVRTCVLAKRWRLLWKSVPALRIDDPETYDGATGSSTFVDELLRRRDTTPLTVCYIRSGVWEEEVSDCEAAFERMEPWLQYAVSCQVQDLRVSFPLRVTSMTLISSHLKRLQFSQMRFDGNSLDFSSCQVLEVLEMDDCTTFAHIYSQSLKYLYIASWFDADSRIYIFATNLVCMQLAVFSGLAPLLIMPSLVSASIILGMACFDFKCCGNLSCDGCDSVALKALSGATYLEVTISLHADYFGGRNSKRIFRNNFKWGHMFSKLKTLWLRDWFVVDDFAGLVYFLQHAPLLEKLTLQLDITNKQHSPMLHMPTVDLDVGRPEGGFVIETNEGYNPREQLLLAKHLKVVTILCETREDGEIPHILKILSAHGVPSEQIVILSKRSHPSKDEED